MIASLRVNEDGWWVMGIVDYALFVRTLLELYVRVQTQFPSLGRERSHVQIAKGVLGGQSPLAHS